MTVLTPDMKDVVEKTFTQNYEHVAVIPNGADAKKFYFSKEARSEIRKQYGIADDTTVFITVASVQERKGQLRFCRYLKDSGMENYRYLILGTGPDTEDIKSFIAENGMEDKVTLVGYVHNTEAYRYLSAADVYAHVSTIEGQSLAEIEAEATGLRIIVNRPLQSSIPGGTDDEDKYFIFDFDKSSYGDFLAWSSKRVVDRKSMTTLDWKNVMEQYMDFYNEILKERKK